MKRINFYAMSALTVFALCSSLAFSGCASTKESADKSILQTETRVDAIYNAVLKMDTHLHVDVPMEKNETPGPDVDLRGAMEKAGMNAIGMTFAVDYVPLTYTGHAFNRFNTALDEFDRILKANNMTYTLNAEEMQANFKKGELSVILSVEGGHFLEGDVSRLEEAYNRGLRVFTLLHDNDALPPLGDVYTNKPEFGGLTELGAAAIKESERLGILVDLAHADDNTVKMALDVATKPVIITHTGLNTRLGNNERMAQMMKARLISAETAKLVASKGGVIGVWPHLADSPEEYAANIKAMVEVIGIDHVAIGTDSKITPEYWDKAFFEEHDHSKFQNGSGQNGEGKDDAPKGPPKQNLDAANHVWNGESDNFYHSVIRCLLAEGFSAEEIAKLAGGNFFRVFDEATK